MPNKFIYLNELKCLKKEDNTGSDEIYITITIDSQNPITLYKDEPLEMSIGDYVKLNKEYVISSQLQIQLHEHDSPDPDDNLGTSSLSSTSTKTGKGVLTFTGSGAKYEISYSVIAPEKARTAEIYCIKCVTASSSISLQLITAITDATSNIIAAFGKATSNISTPYGTLIQGGIDASIAAIRAIPTVAKAIDQATSLPDQLFLTLNNKPQLSHRIWPQRPEKYYELRTGQTYHFPHLHFPLVYPLDFSLWEYDMTPGNDLLGCFTIEPDVASGVYAQMITQYVPTHGQVEAHGAVYLIIYKIVSRQQAVMEDDKIV